MITGTVKFFNADKGYGFIAPEDGGADAFVHISAVERAGMHTLEKDQRFLRARERQARQGVRRQSPVGSIKPPGERSPGVFATKQEQGQIVTDETV